MCATHLVSQTASSGPLDDDGNVELGHTLILSAPQHLDPPVRLRLAVRAHAEARSLAAASVHLPAALFAREAGDFVRETHTQWVTLEEGIGEGAEVEIEAWIGAPEKEQVSGMVGYGRI